MAPRGRSRSFCATARDLLNSNRNLMEKQDSLQELLPIADLTPAAEPLPPKTRRLYCNRDLRLDQIDAIGFDLDYTLAIYRQAEMDRLSIEATARKLVALGYPESLLSMSYLPHFPIRGLLVDTKLGNVLKTDRYRYAKKAYHGSRALGSDERKRLYQGKRIRPGSHYHSIDTLYALSEVTVFAAVVDTLDKPGATLDYEKLFQDVRACIDEAHRDGTIKGEIAQHLPRYLDRDPDLPATLHKLRSAGKKLFLLTNSEWPYTEKVMEYLLGTGQPEYRSWRSYFDVIVSEACKPHFFTDTRALELHELQPAPNGTGAGAGNGRKEPARGRVFRGGCLAEVEALLGVRGDHILYVGDHIYGDVLRAKKESSWRTLMIIQEMTDELDAMERYAPELDRLHRLEARRYALLDGLRDRQGLFKSLERKREQNGLDGAERGELDAAKLRLRRAIDRVRMHLKAVDDEYTALEQRLESAYHPFWGSAFKAESELSSFGEQVERYACLYTDRVTNLLRYSPNHYFRGPRHRMAHE
jgi:HAD superfamily 5'-nucleotidase-like hydrolase